MSLVSSRNDMIAGTKCQGGLPIQLSNTKPSIAFGRLSGATPSVVYLPGFKSSMNGRKGDFLLEYCRKRSLEYVSFDYRANGLSQGDWATQATISNWLTDSLWILDNAVHSKSTILVGSSMGGWLALLSAQRRKEKIGGLILLAPAVDMTRYYPDPATQRQDLLTDEQGRVYYRVPNMYDDQEPYLVYESMLKDGEQHCLLDKTPESVGLEQVPIRILHGINDVDVPAERSRQIMSTLFPDSKDASVTFIENGDHRLSDPQHLQILENTLDELVTKAKPCWMYPKCCQQ